MVETNDPDWLDPNLDPPPPEDPVDPSAGSDPLASSDLVEPTVIDISDQTLHRSKRPAFVGLGEQPAAPTAATPGSTATDGNVADAPHRVGATEKEKRRDRPTPAQEATRPLEGKLAVVTGGSGGIGRAIAHSLGEAGARVAIFGRDLPRLRRTVADAPAGSKLLYLQCDLGSISEIDDAAGFIERFDRPVDIVVHAAGVLVQRGVGIGDVADLDEQYLVNLRGPYALTQRLMPMLQKARGHVVFINSTDGRLAVGGNAQHSMTNHGLTALADSLRHEVSQVGVRVTSIYAGRTATPLAARLCAERDLDYNPALLLQPDDIARSVEAVLSLPARVEVTDVMMKPSDEPVVLGSSFSESV